MAENTENNPFLNAMSVEKEKEKTWAEEIESTGQDIINLTGTKKVYCEIVGKQRLLSTRVDVYIDYGQRLGFFADEFSNKRRLVDKNGNAIKFNSMVDAMNYMGSIGWEFEQAYCITVRSDNVYHWLLSKNVGAEGDTTSFTTKEML